MSKKDKKPLPVFKTDEEAERFVEEADLTDYDLSGGHTVRFEFSKKTAQLNMRLPEDQLTALKKAAKQQGIPYTRLVRKFIDQGMQMWRPSS